MSEAAADAQSGRIRSVKRSERYVTAMPLRVSFRVKRRNRVADLPFSDRPVIQTYSGRVAIYQGVKALGLDGAAVLVPAYACGSEIDAVLKAGCRVVYYPIRRDLSPDLDACHERLSEHHDIRALFVTHYFGFSQPIEEIKAFATENGLALIEDCAHGFLSGGSDGKPLGSSGDISIFSYMKTLPLTDGGACVANSPDVVLRAASLRSPKMPKLAGRFLFQVDQSLSRSHPLAAGLLRLGIRRPLGLAKRAGSFLKGSRKTSPAERNVNAEEAGPSPEMDVIALDPRRSDWAMSWLSRATMERLDLDRVRSLRRRNYKRLLDKVQGIAGLRPLYDTLPDETCPLFLPVELENAAERQKDLAGRGLGTKYFWSYFHDGFPRNEFPFETGLKRSVLALPIHQDLDDDDIDRAGRCLAETMSGSVVS